MKFFALVLLSFCILLSCNNSDNEKGFKTISIAEYLIDVPNNFKFITENGIDSYVGKIVGDSMIFEFDFGYYSNSLGKTIEEYINEKYWCHQILYELSLNTGKEYTLNSSQFEILEVHPYTINDSAICNTCDYVGTVKYQEKIYTLPISIPAYLKKLHYEIDTIDNHHRKIVWARLPEDGLTGIYFKNLDAFNKSVNAHKSLSITSEIQNNAQQNLALKVFRSIRKNSDQ